MFRSEMRDRAPLWCNTLAFCLVLSAPIGLGMSWHNPHCKVAPPLDRSRPDFVPCGEESVVPLQASGLGGNDCISSLDHANVSQEPAIITLEDSTLVKETMEVKLSDAHTRHSNASPKGAAGSSRVKQRCRRFWASQLLLAVTNASVTIVVATTRASEL